VLVGVSFHEFWRDEVRALSIALEAESFLDLISLLTDEGHPALWHAVLRGAYLIWASPAVLPAMSVAVAALAVATFVFIGPFPLWMQGLWIFGVLPVYEYSVMARNYGISMLLWFLFAASLCAKNRRPLLAGMIGLLLSNSNVHSLAILGCIFPAVVIDDIIQSRAMLAGALRKWLLPALLVLSGALLAAYTVYPEDSIIASSRALPVDANWQTFLLDLALPGRNLLHIFPVRTLRALAPILGWLVIFGLWPRPALAVGAYLGLAAFNCFGDFLYATDLRHQGVMYCALLALYWIAWPSVLLQATKSGNGLQAWLCRISVYGVFPAIMVGHGVKGIREVYLEVNDVQSSAQAFGEFLAERPKLADATIIAEPDYLIEAVPYYSDQRIFLAREGQFSKVFHLTTASHAKLSLGQFYATGQQLMAGSGRPIILVIGDELLPVERETSGTITYGPGRSFSWTAEEREAFLAGVRSIGVFHGSKRDENFTAYLLK
jgi:hypothetical protein